MHDVIEIIGLSGFVEVLVPGCKCCAQGTAGIASCGLYPNLLEGSLALESTIGHAVKRNTTGEAQVIYFELFMNRRG